MPNQNNTIEFPTNDTELLKLAMYKVDKGDYADAIRYAYDALLHGGNREVCTVFIAKCLLESGNPDEALRLLFTEFPSSNDRTVDILSTIRMCYAAMYEHIQERRILLNLTEKGEKPSEVDIPEPIEYLLEDYEVALNDTAVYGTDVSSMDSYWYHIRPITGISAVLSAIDQERDGNFPLCEQRMYTVMKASLDDDDSIPGSFIADTMGLYLISAIRNNSAEAVQEYMDSMCDSQKGSAISILNISAMALIAVLTGSDENAAAQMLRTIPTPTRFELNGIANIMIFLNDYEKALELLNYELEYDKYSVGLNRQAAFCAYKTGDYKKSYECYERMSKLLPWDRSIALCKEQCLKAMLAEQRDSVSKADKDFELPLKRGNTLSSFLAAHTEMQKLIDSPTEYIDESTDDCAENTLVSFLPDCNDNVQLSVIKELAASDSDKALRVLRRILLDKKSDSEIKDFILRQLTKRNAKEPIACCCNDSFIEALPRMHTDFNMSDAIYEGYKKCYNAAKRSYGVICALALNSYYEYFIRVCAGFSDLDESDADILGAKLLCMAAQRCGYENDISNVLNKCYPDIKDDALIEITLYLDNCERGYIYDLYGYN